MIHQPDFGNPTFFGDVAHEIGHAGNDLAGLPVLRFH